MDFQKRMSLKRKKRLALIIYGLAVLGASIGLVTYAMRDSIVFFHSPQMVKEKNLGTTRFRLGGLVKAGSVLRGDNQSLSFTVTDGRHSIPVTYRGLVPDLFREGQGVVAEGKLDVTGTFRADTVLARHDETYMPREVADALKQQGHWHEVPPEARQEVPPEARQGTTP